MLVTSEYPDQTLRSVLGLQCLPTSQEWDARLKWVKTTKSIHALTLLKQNRHISCGCVDTKKKKNKKKKKKKKQFLHVCCIVFL